MTAAIQIVMVPIATARAAGGAATVTTSALSGWEIGGSLAGILSGFAALVSLLLFIASTNRKNRRDYESELQRAEDRGAATATDRLAPLLERAQRDADYYRKAYDEFYRSAVFRLPPSAAPPLDPPNPGGPSR